MVGQMVRSNVRRCGSGTRNSGDEFDTVVLPHFDREVGSAGINSDNRTIFFSSHRKRSRDGCGALLSGCGAWNRGHHRRGGGTWDCGIADGIGRGGGTLECGGVN